VWKKPNGVSRTALAGYRPPQLHLQLRAEKRSATGHPLAQPGVGWPISRSFCAHIELRRTDCAALIGPNGAGKSTFLKPSSTARTRREVILVQPAHRLFCPGA